jgi:uncharacterized membrane protein YphA (DoxX/SURF4 family)
MNEVAIAARVLLGAVFIYAGIAKVRTPHWSILALEAGTPRSVVVALPAFEALLGLALVVQLATGFIPWVAVAVLVAFTFTLAHRYFSGSKAPCNCFGGKSNDPVNLASIARNLGLLALALVATQ